MLTPDVKRKQKQAEYYQKNKEKSRVAGASWKKANPDKVRLSNRKLQVLNTYGLTWDKYLQLLTNSGGKCEICGTTVEPLAIGKGTKVAACVDHNHTTGAVRGILCRSCNVALGHFADSKELLKAALLYLEKY